MKASEVLRRYAAGERNFQRVNLRGQSFKDRDLSGADFSYADLQGADFTNAILKDANFSHAKTGLLSYWVVILTVISAVLAIVSGFAAAFTGIVVGSTLLTRTNDLLSIVIALIGLVIFCIVVISKGVTTIIGAFIIVLAASGVLSVALVTALTWEGSGVLGGSVVFTLASVAGATMTGALLLAIAGFSGGSVAVISVLIAAVTGVFTGSFFAVKVINVVFQVWLLTFGWVGAMTVVTALMSAYVSWQTLVGNDKYSLIHAIAVTFATTGGTSFHGANLTDANFTKATLKNTDLKKANLNRTCWHQAKMLDFANVSMTYLEKHIVQQLLITGEGINKNFDGLTLRGINLHGANLVDASFIDANLSEANLQDADLSRSKLVKTQLDETDFTGATLTGAFIEDWGITTHTKLEEVKCEYVFMRLPTKEDPNPHRKPDNWKENFEDDDFADFIKPIFDTLDLYHNQRVDPRAIAISWKQLAEKNPDANLRFASMEVKGEDNLLLRLKTEPNADLSQLSADYFETYNQIKALAEAESKKLLAEKDDRIRSLESFVKTALRQSTRTININQGNYNEEMGGDYHEA